MSFLNLSLKPSYETLSEDPLTDFYIPALENAVAYDRIAGFFSSTSLALAARGIAGLISNGGHMRLIASPSLSKEDIEIIKQSNDDPQPFIEKSMLSDLGELDDKFLNDHVAALGWMLANDFLEIRIACILNDDNIDPRAIFHQKVGIMSDSNGNSLSFSGSLNETASGWLNNSEEFKVFCQWKSGQEDFFNSDKRKFEELWNSERERIRIFEPSVAFKENLIRIGEGFSADKISLDRYVKRSALDHARGKISLFPYQRKAVEKWEGNCKRLLFEMATGTGKTRTAIACVNLAKTISQKFVCITAAPEITLARQWLSEYENLGITFDKVVFADSSSGGKEKWLPEIREIISRIGIGLSQSLLILTTHATASSEDFTNMFNELNPGIKICFIGDEVHGLGAPKQRKALLERFDYRIGLSATPSRWFDEQGTLLLQEYFGNSAFEFTIRDAQLTVNPITQRPFLAPYEYQIEFVRLTEEEMQEYCRITSQIAKLSVFKEDDEAQEKIENLLIRRADITKNAAGKIPAFDELIKNSQTLEKTLVFVSPQQIDGVCEALAANRVCAHPFTEKQGTRKSKQYDGLSEREYLLQEFKNGNYQALVAISCLDEGIDIPSADQAILLSSSTNPREYIQRIGRVIRYHESKDKATIVDFIAEPDWGLIDDPKMLDFEIRSFEKELLRVKEMASNAENGLHITILINSRLDCIYGLQQTNSGQD